MSDPWGDLVYGKLTASDASVAVSTNVVFPPAHTLSFSLQSIRETVSCCFSCRLRLCHSDALEGVLSVVVGHIFEFLLEQTSSGVVVGTNDSYSHVISPLSAVGFNTGIVNTVLLGANNTANTANMTSLNMDGSATVSVTSTIVYMDVGVTDTLPYGPGAAATTIRRGTTLLTVQLDQWRYCGFDATCILNGASEVSAYACGSCLRRSLRRPTATAALRL